MNGVFILISAAFALSMYFIGFHDGAVRAHREVAVECQRLGAFYVGEKTFECKERK